MNTDEDCTDKRNEQKLQRVLQRMYGHSESSVFTEWLERVSLLKQLRYTQQKLSRCLEPLLAYPKDERASLFSADDMRITKDVLSLAVPELTSTLSTDELNEVAQRLDVKCFASGERICTKGAMDIHVLILASGRASITDDDNRETDELIEGDALGEASLLDSQLATHLYPWDVNAEAKSHRVFCLSLAPDQLWEARRIARVRLIKQRVALLGRLLQLQTARIDELIQLASVSFSVQLSPGQSISSALHRDSSSMLAIVICGKVELFYKTRSRNNVQVHIATRYPGDMLDYRESNGHVLLVYTSAAAVAGTTMLCITSSDTRSIISERTMRHLRRFSVDGIVCEHEAEEALQLKSRSAKVHSQIQSLAVRSSVHSEKPNVANKSMLITQARPTRDTRVAPKVKLPSIGKSTIRTKAGDLQQSGVTGASGKDSAKTGSVSWCRSNINLSNSEYVSQAGVVCMLADLVKPTHLEYLLRQIRQAISAFTDMHLYCWDQETLHVLFTSWQSSWKEVAITLARCALVLQETIASVSELARQTDAADGNRSLFKSSNSSNANTREAFISAQAPSNVVEADGDTTLAHYVDADYPPISSGSVSIGCSLGPVHTQKAADASLLAVGGKAIGDAHALASRSKEATESSRAKPMVFCTDALAQHAHRNFSVRRLRDEIGTDGQAVYEVQRQLQMPLPEPISVRSNAVMHEHANSGELFRPERLRM